MSTVAGARNRVNTTHHDEVDGSNTHGDEPKKHRPEANAVRVQPPHDVVEGEGTEKDQEPEVEHSELAQLGVTYISYKYDLG